MKFLRQGRLAAPEFTPVDWSGDSMLLGPLRGRVVLLDFFSYADPEGVRSLTRVRELGDHYRAAGLAVLGVHVPAYEFERQPEDARREIWRLGVPYPVALDLDFRLYRAYGLQNLPARVLVDAAGAVRGWHEGPGEYEPLEQAVRALLREANSEQHLPPPHEPADDLPRAGSLRWMPTPEIRFGDHGVRFGPPDGELPEPVPGAEVPEEDGQPDRAPREFEMPEMRAEGRAYLDGRWSLRPDGIQLEEEEGGVAVVWEGATVSVVASPAGGADTEAPILEITLDGEPLAAEFAGADVEIAEGEERSEIQVGRGRVYELVSRPEVDVHNLDLRVRGRGTVIHLLSFGTRDVLTAS